MLVPEYELGMTILTAGDETFLELVQEKLTVPLIRAADKLAKRQVEEAYAGTYKTSQINSSVELSYNAEIGLEISAWISNGTDMFKVIPDYFHVPATEFHLQVIPTLLYQDQEHLAGELWRMALVLNRPDHTESAVWDDFCVSDIDNRMYAGRSLNELVFWNKTDAGRYNTLELPAFRVSMSRHDDGDSDANGTILHAGLLTQGW
jgi:hypothetical protein